MADLSWHQNRIRDGARGGQEQFQWNSVKDMSFKDRECHLGASTQIGTMGKLGKFNRADWWAHNRGEDKIKKYVDEEKQTVRDFEEELMQEALGLKPKRLLLEKTKLTKEEMQAALKRDSSSGTSGDNLNHDDKDAIATVETAKGLGFAAHRTAKHEAQKAALYGVSEELDGEGISPQKKLSGEEDQEDEQHGVDKIKDPSSKEALMQRYQTNPEETTPGSLIPPSTLVDENEDDKKKNDQHSSDVEKNHANSNSSSSRLRPAQDEGCTTSPSKMQNIPPSNNVDKMLSKKEQKKLKKQQKKEKKEAKRMKRRQKREVRKKKKEEKKRRKQDEKTRKKRSKKDESCSSSSSSDEDSNEDDNDMDDESSSD